MKLAVAVLLLLLLLVLGAACFMYMKRRRPTPATAAAPSATLVAELRRDVTALCAIGPRNTFLPKNLAAAASLVERELQAAGYTVERQRYRVEQDGADADNLIAELKGSDEIVVIGAHYDSVEGTVGADDNASGVAALLALARRFANTKPKRTLRFVAFANEEPPHFQTRDMGSWQYARRCHDRGEKVVAMLSLETIGYYRDEPGSQQYPAPLAAFYPDKASFIAFASNIGSRGLLKRCVDAFQAATRFPVESAAMPEAVTGISWSDQWSFWQFGYPAICVTDTALFRNPNYHTPHDRPETIDYERTAHVVEGLAGVVRELVR